VRVRCVTCVPATNPVGAVVNDTRWASQPPFELVQRVHPDSSPSAKTCCGVYEEASASSGGCRCRIVAFFPVKMGIPK
jgi:hypothetical protein